MTGTSSLTPSIALAARAGDLWNRLERPELAGGAVYWLESSAPEGRSELLRRTHDGKIERVSPEGVDVRSGVYEYGGGAYAAAGTTVAFVSLHEGRLYAPEPLTEAASDAIRYGDLALVGGDIVCVREQHLGGTVVDELVRVSAVDGTATVLDGGHDFYSSPSASPDGALLAWLTWDHPGMPFLGSDLWCAAMRDDGMLGEARHVAGGRTESIFQPQWSPDGRLFYVSDRSGWWNLHIDGGEPVGPVAAEVGWPQWLLGLSSYAFLDDGRIAALVNRGGRQRLSYLRQSGTWEDAGLPHEHVAWPYLRGDGRNLVFVAAEPDRPPELVLVDTERESHEVVRRSLEAELAPQVARATPFAAAGPDGEAIRAFLYTPPSATEPPPLVVLAHGGPTDQTVAGLRLDVQLLTSRGFAVVDVDYGGSTGYGRAYRERLVGAWGVRDVEDCASVAKHLIAAGAVDPQRVAIMGGSAGGYIALCGVAFADVFRAGVSLYGIADPELFNADTHKFEASYADWLTGGKPARAPARSAAFGGPLLLLQGTDDRIVTPAHAELMIEAYRRAGLPIETVIVEGEGHGFRREESLVRVYTAILDFLERAFAR